MSCALSASKAPLLTSVRDAHCLYFASSFSTPAAKSSSFFSRPSPSWRRTNRRITRFSPSLAIFSFKTSWTVLSSSLSHFWLNKAVSSNFFFKRPTTIFSLMLSGLPSRSSLPISNSFSFSTTSAGTSSTVTNFTSGFAAICMATSFANSLKIALMATKSVSLFTSTSTPSLELKCTYEATIPSTDTLPAFLSAFAMPFFFNQSIAASMSPPHSDSAFFASKIPAPDRPRSSLTCAAETATLGFSSFSSFFSSLGTSAS
mmetsp:Transcript_45783/g.106992  ORF Transcript_45783/g.106992 Transcript_45783/m.106992 type:complete len:259 (-) Transcript_45783:32-808(-)